MINMTVYNGGHAARGSRFRKGVYTALAALGTTLFSIGCGGESMTTEPPPNRPPTVRVGRELDPEGGEVGWGIKADDPDGDPVTIHYDTHAGSGRVGADTAYVEEGLRSGTNSITTWATDNRGGRGNDLTDDFYIPTEQEARDIMTQVVGNYSGFSSQQDVSVYFLDDEIPVDLLVTDPDGRNAVIMYANAAEDYDALVTELDTKLGVFIPHIVVPRDEAASIRSRVSTFIEGL
ncbi:MAG: hypothetical protein JSV63_01475 [Candidatus Aenigmatarchaeota archaeon]|nr:MAG: hypothetical protein JSV63_01475 [Candidatus Aenigmarchaeota archaeon]